MSSVRNILVTLAVGGTDVIYGVTMLALQLIVVAVVIGSLFSARARRLGLVALVITLVFNVATVGGMSALQTSAAGSYDGMKTEQQKHEEAYPAIKGEDPQNALRQQSLEEVRAESEELFADIRARITAEFGYEWVQVGDGQVVAMRLAPDLRSAAGDPHALFSATSAPWVAPLAGEAPGSHVTDGPFLETKEALGGYYVSEADDLETAVEIAKDVPVPHGFAEVRPVMVFDTP